MIKIENRNFIPKDILECGQVFRYQKFENGYIVKAKDQIAILSDREIVTSDDSFFNSYFDMDKNYGEIITALGGNSLLDSAMEHGKGIRILKQDCFEAVISFIISANNNIPRIKGIIERLCSSLGEKKEFLGHEYHAFPTAERLASCGEGFFASMGLGYRARYIASTAKQIASGFDLEEIHSFDTQVARAKLCTLLGVGGKVADCILLFAYGRFDCFPVDTWMQKVYYDYFENKRLSAKDISLYFTKKYKGLSGYAQQYLFYYKKNLEENGLC